MSWLPKTVCLQVKSNYGTNTANPKVVIPNESTLPNYRVTNRIGQRLFCKTPNKKKGFLFPTVPRHFLALSCGKILPTWQMVTSRVWSQQRIIQTHVSYEESQDRVVPLEPGATVSFRVTLDPLTDEESVAAAVARVEKLTGDDQPTVHNSPRPGWSPGA